MKRWLLSLTEACLKVQIALACFFSFHCAWLFLPFKCDSLYEDYFWCFSCPFFFLFPLYFGIYAVDGMMNLENKELIEVNEQTLHLLWETSFWTKTFENPLSDTTLSWKIGQVSHSRYQAFNVLSFVFLKLFEYFLTTNPELDDKKILSLKDT